MSELDKWRELFERLYSRLADRGVDQADIERLRNKGEKVLKGG